MPDVSVIVATKNSAPFLDEALASIATQGAVTIELIVVDADSHDGTQEIACRHQARLIDQKEGRLGAAWNLGIAAATAPVIGFLDSDDRWVRETLRARLAALATLSGPGISIGRVCMFLESGFQVPTGLNPEVIGRELPSPIPGCMLVSRELFDSVGAFDDSYAIASDVDWFGRALAKDHQPAIVDAVVLEKRVHGKNLSLTGTQNSAELLRALRRRISTGGC